MGEEKIPTAPANKITPASAAGHFPDLSYHGELSGKNNTNARNIWRD
jgi:hypothetical protein